MLEMNVEQLAEQLFNDFKNTQCSPCNCNKNLGIKIAETAIKYERMRCAEILKNSGPHDTKATIIAKMLNEV